MGVRRGMVVGAAIVVSLVSYLWLAHKYNPDTVEFVFKENITREDFESIRDANKDVLFVINYTMQYKGDKLIMTTGQDYLAKSITLSEGIF